MTFLTRELKHETTYWAQSGVDSSGDATFSAPVSILARWEEKESVFRGADGTERRSNRVVYLSQDVQVGDFLFKGTSVEADPRDQIKAFRVEDFARVEFFNGNAISRMALL